MLVSSISYLMESRDRYRFADSGPIQIRPVVNKGLINSEKNKNNKISKIITSFIKSLYNNEFKNEKIALDMIA